MTGPYISRVVYCNLYVVILIIRQCRHYNQCHHYYYHHHHCHYHYQEQRIEEELLNIKNKKSTPVPEMPEAILKGKEKLLVRKLNDITEVDYRKRKCRLILRNLSFLATEANVADKMSKFGPLVEV